MEDEGPEQGEGGWGYASQLSSQGSLLSGLPGAERRNSWGEVLPVGAQGEHAGLIIALPAISCGPDGQARDRAGVPCEPRDAPRGWGPRGENRDPGTREQPSLLESVAHLTPPELPPSDPELPVPEEAAQDLFAVYAFLRSFSQQLFLSPFTLHDLVTAIKSAQPSELFDAVHVALLRASAGWEGSARAKKDLKRY